MKEFIRFLRFCFVGASNTLIFLFLYYIQLELLKVNYIWANIISYALGGIWGYYWQSRKVFYNHTSSSVLKYYVVYFSSFILHMSISYILVDLMKINQELAPYIVLAFTIPYNYISCKRWVYRGEEYV